MNFFTPRLMKIRLSFLFLGSFVPDFQIKLSIHGSNFNFMLVIMIKLKVILLMGVWIQNFNTMDLVNIFEKIKNFTFRL
jgi:hypothetical protein